MVDTEKLMAAAELFDRDGVKVIGALPKRLELHEIVGIQHHPDKTTKISFRRDNTLYLAWVETKEAMPTIIRFKQEINALAESWDERWEPWELSGSSEPRMLHSRVVQSRLRNQGEREEAAKYLPGYTP